MSRFRPFMTGFMRTLLATVSSLSAGSPAPSVSGTTPLSSIDVEFETGLDRRLGSGR